MLLYDVGVFDGLDARSVTATERPKFKFKERAMFRKEMKRALSFRFHWTKKYRTILPERFFGQGHPDPKAPCSDAVQLFRPLVSYPMPAMSYTMPNLKRKVPTFRSSGEGCSVGTICLQV